MTLTEEQREAIRVISKLPMAIGCQLCHPYIMENYGSHFIVLRDMIDSSEHVTEPTKMIGFDLEAARAGIAHYRIENTPNVDTERALKELVDQANLAEDAIAEIGRLRGHEIAARDLSADLTKVAGERDELAARITGLETAYLKAQNSNLLRKQEIERLRPFEIAAELEDDLVEERAKYNLSWKDCAYRAPDTYCEKTHNYCTSEDCPLLDEQKTEARRQLQAEGKIGPGARPQSWQITEERIGLLEYCLETLLDAPDIEEIPGPGHSIEVLRAMLREAE